MPELTIRLARDEDLPRLHAVIERAYRGEEARSGWTHEADLLEGTRTDTPSLRAIIANPGERLLMIARADAPVGCVQVSDRGNGVAYLGLLCVDPTLQAGGIGKRLVEAAEQLARTAFAASNIEMTVIETRVELIAYYERRGYMRTEERRDFPLPVVPPLHMAVLVKSLG
jgi:ribosomal protein S18 acetylase RimI-like enzyme